MYMQVPAVRALDRSIWEGLAASSTVFLWDHIFKLIKSSC